MVVAGAATLSACSSTPAAAPTTTVATTTTTTNPNRGDQPICSLVEPSTIKKFVGTDVEPAVPTVRGTTTTCTYRAHDESQTVIIGYDTAATSASFESQKSAAVDRADRTIEVPELGDQAYAATVSSGGQSVTSVVALRGNLQVTVVGPQPAIALEDLAAALFDGLQSTGSAPSTSSAG